VCIHLIEDLFEETPGCEVPLPLGGIDGRIILDVPTLDPLLVECHLPLILFVILEVGVLVQRWVPRLTLCNRLVIWGIC
jgi:hypothetical protein